MLATLAPTRLEGQFVFASVSEEVLKALPGPGLLCTFREAEGVSVLVDESLAREHGLAFDGLYSGITLGVYSSLAAVGLTAAVATALAEKGIPANVIAACHHDHVFVPVAQLEAAMEVLAALSTGKGL